MKTTRAQFAQFKAAFKHWQKEFGVVDYEIYFRLEPLSEEYAKIAIDYAGKVATVSMAAELDAESAAEFEIDRVAMHEALHLLLHRISYIGRCRWAGEAEMQDAEEGVVRVLEKLLTRKG